MRTRRFLVVAATVLAAGVLATAPAQAGAWTETVLDPPPATVEPKVTYTFGFWVLQHGSYPSKAGDLGPVALTAADADGTTVRFPATKSATEGHYSAEVVFPHEGEWQIGTEQATLMPDRFVAVVTVPGAVRIMPSEVEHRAPHEWGAVRPSFPPTAEGAEVDAPQDYAAEKAQPLVEPRSARSESAVGEVSGESGGGVAVELVVAGGLLLVAGAAGLGRRYLRRRED